MANTATSGRQLGKKITGKSLNNWVLAQAQPFSRMFSLGKSLTSSRPISFQKLVTSIKAKNPRHRMKRKDFGKYQVS